MELYKHTKTGKMYELVTRYALHSETMEMLVVYKGVDTGVTWVRPERMFFENVELDGKSVPRFQKVEKEDA